MTNQWERQPGETDASWAAFQEYLALPSPRSAHAVHVARGGKPAGRVPGYLQNWELGLDRAGRKVAAPWRERRKAHEDYLWSLQLEEIQEGERMLLQRALDITLRATANVDYGAPKE